MNGMLIWFKFLLQSGLITAGWKKAKSLNLSDTWKHHALLIQQVLDNLPLPMLFLSQVLVLSMCCRVGNIDLVVGFISQILMSL